MLLFNHVSLSDLGRAAERRVYVPPDWERLAGTPVIPCGLEPARLSVQLMSPEPKWEQIWEQSHGVWCQEA